MSSCPATKYQVFLSFRGTDTRCNFISFLYNALVDRKIQTFKDDEELETGQRISSELNRAIEDSKIAVVVVSVNYAESPWCLEELVKIMDLEKKKKITVMPIFYGVEPCDVRWQMESVEEHFKKHEDEVKDHEKVLSWRRALTDLANLSGECSSKWNDDAKLVNGIADKILKDPRIVTTSSNQRQLVGNGKHMKQIEGLLDLNSNENLRVVGIWAIGCKSRWALATNVYHNFSQQFDSHCFLEDVEKSSHQGRHLVHLPEELAKSSKKNQKVLVVANNVNKVEQFEALAEEFNLFGPGSVFIVTTQDKQLFNSFGIKLVYEQELLRFQEVIPDRSIAFKKSNKIQKPASFELFSSSGFGLCDILISSPKGCGRLQRVHRRCEVLGL